MASKYARIGAVRSPAATGSQATTGLGFRPKALVFWGENTAISVPEFNDFPYWSFGWTDGSAHLATSSISFDNHSPTDENREAITTAPITARDTANGIQHEATLTSLDSDGFTLNWTAINASEQRYFNYLALGGVDVSVKSGMFASATAAGNQAVTGVGFRPTGVLFCAVWASGGGNGALNIPALGWTDGTRQGASYVVSKNGSTAAATWRYQRTNKCVALGDETTGAVLAEAAIVSLDADGFTVNWTTAPASAVRVFYLAFNGASVYVGSVSQPTTAGTQAVTGTGFRVGSVLFQSVGQTSQSTVQSEHRFMFGGATRTAQRVGAQHDKDAVNPCVSARYYSQTLAIANMTAVATGTSSTLDSAASVSSLDADGFTLDWTTVDATSREILFIATNAEEPGLIVGSCVFGENGAVTAPRAGLFSFNGNANTNGDEGKLKVCGDFEVTGTSTIPGIGTGDIESDGSVDFAADQSMGGFNLTDVADPVDPQDAATKAYVDANIGGSGSGNVTSTGAAGSEPAAPASGDLYLPNNGLVVERYSGSAWASWGPIFPLTAPSDGSFAWTNQGGASVDATNGGIYLLAPATTGTSWRIRTKSIGTNVRLETAILPNLIGDSTSASQGGLILRESSTGKLATFGVAAGDSTFAIQHWSNATTFTANDHVSQKFHKAGALWLAIELSGSNILYSLSSDGQHWIQVFSIAKTSQFTSAPDQWGFAVNAGQTTHNSGLTLISFKES